MPNLRTRPVGDRALHLIGAIAVGALLALACTNPPPLSQTQLGEWALDNDGDWRQARIHFALALREDPRSARALHGQARAHLAARDPEAALASLGKIVKYDPAYFKTTAQKTYGNALEGVTVRRVAGNKTKSGLVSARALYKLDPNRSGVKRLLGQALLAEADHRRLRGDRKTAYVLFEEACGVVPQEIAGWVGAAEILIEYGKNKDAVRLLKAARRFHPTSGQIRTLSIQAISTR